MITIEINNIKDLQEAAKKFLGYFSKPGVFAFYGEMGAGKTSFIQSVCKELNVLDVVTSPTFSLVNEYKSSQHGMLYHFDFYRIQTIREVFDLGYEEYFFQDQYCFIEWPEKIEPLLPESTIKVYLEVMSPGKRRLSFSNSGE